MPLETFSWGIFEAMGGIEAYMLYKSITTLRKDDKDNKDLSHKKDDLIDRIY